MKGISFYIGNFKLIFMNQYINTDLFFYYTEVREKVESMRNKNKENPGVITQEIVIETMAAIDIRKAEELEKMVKLT